MDTLHANQSSADWHHQTSLAQKAIEEVLKRKLTGWTGPEIVTQPGDYKVEWFGPDDGPEERLTMYADGSWAFDSEVKGASKEGKLPPLHSTRWLTRMEKAGVTGIIAKFSVEFFKNLKKKERRR